MAWVSIASDACARAGAGADGNAGNAIVIDDDDANVDVVQGSPL